MASDFLAKAATHVEKASRQDYGESDMTTLPPETPLAGEWDDEPGKPFSEGNNDTSIDQGPHALGTGIDGRGEDAARAEALNDALRPLDRYAGGNDRRTAGVPRWWDRLLPCLGCGGAREAAWDTTE